MKTIVITGASNGIGKAVAQLFHDRGFRVIGIDKEEATLNFSNYIHYKTDCSDKNALPDLEDVNYLFINAGSQGTIDDIKNNLYSAIYTTEKYAFNDVIEGVVFNASVSAHNGAEFTDYICSKGGMLPLMKQTAGKLAARKVPVNSLSCGGVTTDLNKPVMENRDLWNEIMEVTPMKKWATPEEVAEWVYFLMVINRSVTAEDILLDNGEYTLASTLNFKWPKN